VHQLERVFPALAQFPRRADDQLAVFDFQLELVNQPALLDHGPRQPDAAGNSRSRSISLDDYFAMTEAHKIEFASREPNST
jgi:hypothetical protein